ncbi:MAG: ribose 5-phosphate isomerase B [Nitrospirae bacterium]|jgi:ribose 5-phosphate isomerase B|nr:ribose 5-phosphate isomerase B [Nitrospirota bacterium]
MPNVSTAPSHIFFGSDHAGRELKEILIAHAKMRGLVVEDLGTYTDESVDYPDFAEKVARAVVSDPASLGVLVCGTGIGMSIAANKIHGIRAALLYNESSARLARQHNNANIIAMGGREISPDQAITWFDIFLATVFEGGRHGRRLEKIARLEGP